MKVWFVNIIESETGAVVKSIQCGSERKAERVEDGIGINLDWDKYETQIEFIRKSKPNEQQPG